MSGFNVGKVVWKNCETTYHRPGHMPDLVRHRGKWVSSQWIARAPAGATFTDGDPAFLLEPRTTEDEGRSD